MNKTEIILAAKKIIPEQYGLTDAIDFLSKHLNEYSQPAKELIGIKARINSIETERRLGTIGIEEKERILNNIRKSFLDLMEKVADADLLQNFNAVEVDEDTRQVDKLKSQLLSAKKRINQLETGNNNLQFAYDTLNDENAELRNEIIQIKERLERSKYIGTVRVSCPKCKGMRKENKREKNYPFDIISVVCDYCGGEGALLARDLRRI